MKVRVVTNKTKQVLLGLTSIAALLTMVCHQHYRHHPSSFCNASMFLEIPNGQVQQPNSSRVYQPGDSFNITCDEGYINSKEERVVCDDKWLFPEDACEVLAYIQLISEEEERTIENEDKSSNDYFAKVEPWEIVYVLVVCEVSKKEVTDTKNQKNAASKTFLRQKIQLEVLFKTAALFAKRQIHFVIVTNTLKTFLMVNDIPSQWPEHLRRNLKLSRRSIWHPSGEASLLNVFRPCTVECLFLHETLPDIDAAVYIDTDTFFLRSPEDIWSYFQSFNHTQMAGMSPCYYYYGTSKFMHNFGFYGNSGLNAGVIMMNLTRMRAVSFNLSRTYLDMYKRFASKMDLLDQDILNHFYSVYPQMLYPIECTWNMRYLVCDQDPFPCESAKHGISLFHGCDLSFFGDKDESVKNIFDALSRFDIAREDLEILPEVLRTAIEYTSNNKMNICGHVKGFADMITKYPRDILT